MRRRALAGWHALERIQIATAQELRRPIGIFLAVVCLVDGFLIGLVVR